MSSVSDRPTRFSVDLLESAAAEGARQSRSAKQQLDYWARVGRAVTMHHTAAGRRIESVLAGDLPMAELSESEQAVANAQLDAAIQQDAQRASYGERLAGEGVTTVALDEDGNLVEYRPDGTMTLLG